MTTIKLILLKWQQFKKFSAQIFQTYHFKIEGACQVGEGVIKRVSYLKNTDFPKRFHAISIRIDMEYTLIIPYTERHPGQASVINLRNTNTIKEPARLFFLAVGKWK